MVVTRLLFEREFVLLVSVVEGRGRVAGHAHETAVNAGQSREIAAGGQGHEIDAVGQGHTIEGNTDQGHIRENVCGGRINRIVAGVPMMKISMQKNFPSNQLSDMYVSLISVHRHHLVSDQISFLVPNMLIFDGFCHFRFRPKMILRM